MDKFFGKTPKEIVESLGIENTESLITSLQAEIDKQEPVDNRLFISFEDEDNYKECKIYGNMIGIHDWVDGSLIHTIETSRESVLDLKTPPKQFNGHKSTIHSSGSISVFVEVNNEITILSTTYMGESYDGVSLTKDELDKLIDLASPGTEYRGSFDD